MKSTGQTNSNLQNDESSKLVGSWIETAQKFWLGLGIPKEKTSTGAGFNFNFATAPNETEENKYKTYKTWASSVSNFTSLVKIMTAPENQENIARSVLAFSEGVAETAGDSLEKFADYQGQLLKSFAKVGEHTTAYSFDDLDRTAFESFRELYRSEFQKYLYMPKIGLPREYHEQVSQLIDKSNVFSSYLLELVYLFTIPFEKTNRLTQQKINLMLEKGEIAGDSKQAYNEWIKTLVGHFMELLKSREYTEALNNTITSLAAYKNFKTDVIDVFLKELQIPTRKDMDLVYKDLYQMKKKIRALPWQVEKLQGELQQQYTVRPVEIDATVEKYKPD